jgi:hypothetical protein
LSDGLAEGPGSRAAAHQKFSKSELVCLQQLITAFDLQRESRPALGPRGFPFYRRWRSLLLQRHEHLDHAFSFTQRLQGFSNNRS